MTITVREDGPVLIEEEYSSIGGFSDCVLSGYNLPMRTLELPDPVFDKLIDAAQANHTTPVDWIAARLSLVSINRDVSEQELIEADQRLFAFFGIANSGDPDSSNNERIDADLYS